MSKSRSGFSVFCSEWQSAKEKEGYHFNNVREVMANEECFDTWKNLSEDIKDYYRILARCNDHHSKVEEKDKKYSTSTDSHPSSPTDLAKCNDQNQHQSKAEESDRNYSTPPDSRPSSHANLQKYNDYQSQVEEEDRNYSTSAGSRPSSRTSLPNYNDYQSKVQEKDRNYSTSPDSRPSSRANLPKYNDYRSKAEEKDRKYSTSPNNRPLSRTNLAKFNDYQSKVQEKDRKYSTSQNGRPSSRTSYRRPSHASNRSVHSLKPSSGKTDQPKPQLPPNTRRFKGTMEEYMSLLMGSTKQYKSVQNLTFYIIHANYFYFREFANNVSDYYPVEVAVSECSLENGVQRVHHVIVKEDIVKGYRNDAIVRAEESHKMPIDFSLLGKVDVETDYSEIFQGICRFIEPGSIDGELPPVFTMSSNHEHIWKPTKSILGRLALADSKHPDFLLLYSFEELFGFITNIVMRREWSEFDVAQAIERLEKDPNAYRNGLGCEYHKRVQDGEYHCSSHFVKRWWYRLCDYCCGPLGIEKIPGVHGLAEESLPQTLVFTKLNLKPKFGLREPRDQKRHYNYSHK